MDIDELLRKHCLRRGLSPRTIQTYRHCLKRFFRRCPKEPKQVKKSDVSDYLDKILERGRTGSTLNVYLSAFKFLFNEILNKRLMVYFRFSKTPKTIPVFLTKEEAQRLFNSISNTKHFLMVTLMYGAGLRVSELLNLRVCDLDTENHIGWVRHGKGNKDRPFIIPLSLKPGLGEHISKECPMLESFLFPGMKDGFPLSTRTVQTIIKKAAKKAGILKGIHPHTLRHSFATHLIEDENPVTSVQSLLGHASVETTMAYVHAASPKCIGVRSPLDCLNSRYGELRSLDNHCAQF